MIPLAVWMVYHLRSMRTAMSQDLSFPRWIAWLVPVVIWGGLSGAAHAATATIVESREDGAPPAEQAKLRGAVEKALQAMQIELIPVRDVEAVIAGEAQLQGCYSELCFERLGRLLDSQLVVYFRAKPLSPAGKKPGLQLSIALFDGGVGAMARASKRSVRSAPTPRRPTSSANGCAASANPRTARPCCWSSAPPRCSARRT